MAGIGSLRGPAKKVQQAGRNGDTILAHINPQEAAMLKRMGGAGSINPKTGLPEFALGDTQAGGGTGTGDWASGAGANWTGSGDNTVGDPNAGNASTGGFLGDFFTGIGSLLSSVFGGSSTATSTPTQTQPAPVESPISWSGAPTSPSYSIGTPAGTGGYSFASTPSYSGAPSVTPSAPASTASAVPSFEGPGNFGNRASEKDTSPAMQDDPGGRDLPGGGYAPGQEMYDGTQEPGFSGQAGSVLEAATSPYAGLSPVEVANANVNDWSAPARESPAYNGGQSLYGGYQQSFTDNPPQQDAMQPDAYSGPASYNGGQSIYGGYDGQAFSGNVPAQDPMQGESYGPPSYNPDGNLPTFAGIGLNGASQMGGRGGFYGGFNPDIAPSMGVAPGSQQPAMVAGLSLPQLAQYQNYTKNTQTAGLRTQPILDVVKREAKGYNTIVGGKQVPGLTDMTLSQVMNFQQNNMRGLPSTAVGQYQVVNGTLQGAIKGLGLDPTTTKFTPEIQDQIASYLAEQRVEKAGGWNQPTAVIANALLPEWASLTGPNGKSYYEGFNGNKGYVGWTDLTSAVDAAKRGGTQLTTTNLSIDDPLATAWDAQPSLSPMGPARSMSLPDDINNLGAGQSRSSSPSWGDKLGHAAVATGINAGIGALTGGAGLLGNIGLAAFTGKSAGTWGADALLGPVQSKTDIPYSDFRASGYHGPLDSTAIPGYQAPNPMVTGYSFVDQQMQKNPDGTYSLKDVTDPLSGIGTLAYSPEWSKNMGTGQYAPSSGGGNYQYERGDGQTGQVQTTTPQTATTASETKSTTAPSTTTTKRPPGAPSTWDEQAFLAANPEIAAAIKNGQWDYGYAFNEAFKRTTGKSYTQAKAENDQSALAYGRFLLATSPGVPVFEDESVPAQYQTQKVTEPYASMGIQSLYGMGKGWNYFPNTSGRRTYATGGFVDGPGTETSDSIPAVIDGKTPAALSSGEFVWTGKSVRGVGGGDRNTGARRLYSMMKKAERLA